MNKRELTEGEQLGIQLAKELTLQIQARAGEKVSAEIQIEASIAAFQYMSTYLSIIFTKKEILEMCLVSSFMTDEEIEESKNSLKH